MSNGKKKQPSNNIYIIEIHLFFFSQIRKPKFPTNFQTFFTTENTTHIPLFHNSNCPNFQLVSILRFLNIYLISNILNVTLNHIHSTVTNASFYVSTFNSL